MRRGRSSCSAIAEPTARTASSTRAEPYARASWLPLVVIASAQILLVFNVTTLKVSIDGIADSLGIAASTVKTALVTYFVVVAGTTMLGAKLGTVLGPRTAFRGMLALFAVAMLLTMASANALTLVGAQVAAGVASAAVIPALVVLVGGEYRGAQRAKALAWFGALQAVSLVPAFIISGALGAWLGWRSAFGLLAVLAALACVLSGKLATVQRRSAERIDAVGVALIAAAFVLIGVGSDQLLEWGVLRARPNAPFSLAAISPALIVIVCGALLLKAFAFWERQCRASGRTPLLAPEVLATPRERSALLSIFAIGVIGAGITFLLPLYLEVVQGRNSWYTALALLPFTVAGFAAATLVVRLQSRPKPYRIARHGFLLVAAGLALLGTTIRNDWSDAAVMTGLALAGLGEGALTTHLFNVLVARAPRELTADVAPLCGAASYLAAGVGTALAGALAIGVLGVTIQRDLVLNPVIPEELKIQLNLDKVAFVSNDRLLAVLERTTATPEQVMEAARINAAARLRALKVSFFALAFVAFVAFFPAGRVPIVPSVAPPDAGPS